MKKRKMKLAVRTLAFMLVAVFVWETLPLNSIAMSAEEQRRAADFSLTQEVSELSPIVLEDEEQRTQYSKTFMREDGSFTTVVSPMPIHYEDEDEWVDIDNTLEETDNALENKSNSFSARLPQEIDDNSGVSITQGDYELTFVMNEIDASEAEVDKTEVELSGDLDEINMQEKSSLVTYEKIQKNTDISYAILPNQVKESIIINKKPGSAVEYEYTVTIPGASLSLLDDGSVKVSDGTNELFLIESPYMFDNDGEISDEVDVTLAQNEDGSYTLVYTPDYSWLKQLGRSYPVTVDPTVTIRGTSRSVDANPGWPLNHANFDFIKGLLGTQYLLKFSDNYIPKNCAVTKATLSTYMESNTSDDEFDNLVSIYVAPSDWTASPQLVDVSGLSLIDYQDVPAVEAEKQYIWDVTSAVGNWSLGFEENHGFIIAPHSLDTEVKIRHIANNLSWQQPTLSVTYVEDEGVNEEVFPYDTVDMGRAGTAYINQYTGKFSFVREELSVPGNVMPVSLQRNFFGVTPQTPMSSGWQMSSYSEAIYSTGNDYYHYIGFDGKATFFTNSGKTDSNGRVKYLPQREDLEGYVIWRDPNETSGVKYADMCLEIEGGHTYYYNQVGRISKVVDTQNAANAEINFTYASATSVTIREITDGAGRTYKFTNTSVSGTNCLTKIQLFDASGQAVSVQLDNNTTALMQMQYEYEKKANGNVYLTKAIYPDGEFVTYSYNNDGLMTSVTNIDGTKLVVTYNGNIVTNYKTMVNDGGTWVTVQETAIDFTSHNIRTFSTSSVYDPSQLTTVIQYSEDFKERYREEKKNGDTLSIIIQNLQNILSELKSIFSHITIENNIPELDIVYKWRWSLSSTPALNSNHNWSFSSDVTSGSVNSSNVKINGGPGKNAYAYKKIELNGKTGDVYTFSAWAKANAAVARDDRSFSIAVRATDENGIATDEVLASYDYNDNIVLGETGACSFELSEDMQYVYLYLVYDNQINEASFDKMTLYHSDDEITDDGGNSEEGCKCEGCETENCACRCENKESCTCESCKKCECDGCTEANCPCRCASESSCTHPQCKRKTITQKDDYGNVLSETVTNATKEITTSSSYLTGGNYQFSSTDADGIREVYYYDAKTGRLSGVEQDNTVIDYTYDAMGLLTSVSQAVSNLVGGTAMTNTYTYEKDQLSTITHNGITYSFTYDAYGNTTSVKVNNQNLVSYDYNALMGSDATKNLGKITYGNGQTLTYSYDNNYAVITGISLDNGTTMAYTYSYDKDKLKSYTDNISGTKTTYSDTTVTTRRLSDDTLIYSKTSKDGEDTVDNLYGASYTYKTSSSYNMETGTTTDQNTITGISGSRSLVASKDTDYFGREPYSFLRFKKDGANKALVRTNSYYPSYANNKTSTRPYIYKNAVLNPSGAVTGVYEYEYEYDSKGNISKIKVNSVVKYSYSYDAANQLVRENDKDRNVTTTYQYDVGGNLVSKKTYPYSASSLGTLQSTTNYTYDTVWKDKLASYDGKAITYDAIGNPLTYDGATFTWSAGRQLNSYTKGSTSVSYKYNADGLRTSKRVTKNGLYTDYEYVWSDDGTLIAQTVGFDTARILYSNDSPVGFVVNNSETFAYVKNLQGDITAIVDENGVMRVEYKYDAWGNPQATGDATVHALNPCTYRGYYYDAETGLYYLQSRYYNSEWGRFLNADVAEMSIMELITDEPLCTNLFAYCYNNSVMYDDPFGLIGGTIIIAGITFTAGKLAAIAFLLVVCFAYMSNPQFRTAVNSAILWAVKGIITGVGSILKKYPKVGKWAAKVISTLISTYASVAATQALPKIAKKYDNFKCKEAAEAMKKELKKRKLPGAIVQLHFPNAHNGYVMSKKYNNTAISGSGNHYGVLFNGRIYCNIYPSGLSKQTWISSFYAASNAGKKVYYYYF